MDLFNEKIVWKRKRSKDYLIIAAIILAALVLPVVIINIKILQGIFLFVVIGVIYGAYYLISSRNIEYEYVVTNGDIDIDKIIARRKRKRVFSASCKDFEVLAPITSDKYTPQIKNFKNKLDYTGTGDKNAVWFATLRYKGEQTVLFFEPSEKMIQNFKVFIPRKIFTK